MKPLSVRNLSLAALFAALTAVASQISIPLPFTPIPVNLALLAVVLSGSLLGPVCGALSQLVFIALGAMGLPVFAGFHGGLSALAGPTGGFLVGYVLCSLLVGVLVRKPARQKAPVTALCLTAGILLCYALGVLWFMLLTGNGFIAALTLCVLPFLPGDALKIIVATLLTRRLAHQPALYGQ